MPQHTEAEQKRRAKVRELFSGKPIPGGTAMTAFERVIQQLQRAVIGNKKKKRKKTQAERLFGEDE